jgi:hypothetical protein
VNWCATLYAIRLSSRNCRADYHLHQSKLTLAKSPRALRLVALMMHCRAEARALGYKLDTCEEFPGLNRELPCREVRE